MQSKTAWPRRACSLPSTGDSTASSLMSAPATNDFSPAPVSTIARTPASALQLGHRGRSSRERLGVQRVQDLGAVERDDGDGAVALDQQVFKGHKRLMFTPRPRGDAGRRARRSRRCRQSRNSANRGRHEHLMPLRRSRRARVGDQPAPAPARRRVTPDQLPAGRRAQRQQRQARVAGRVQQRCRRHRRDRPRSDAASRAAPCR